MKINYSPLLFGYALVRYVWHISGSPRGAKTVPPAATLRHETVFIGGFRTHLPRPADKAAFHLLKFIPICPHTSTHRIEDTTPMIFSSSGAMKGYISLLCVILFTSAWASVIGPDGNLIIANQYIAPDGFNRSYVSCPCFSPLSHF